MVRLCFALRRDPLKPLLAATALHYGGLVPMHITYDEPNQCAAQVNSLWARGYAMRPHIVLTSPLAS